VEQGIAALTGVPHPTLLAESTMRWEAQHAPTPELRSMAGLALGTMARNLAATEPSRSAKIVDGIIRKLAASPSPEEARLGLMALGNAGSARALPTLSRYMADRSPVLRARAVAALRWIDDPRVDPWLTRALQRDPAPEVRREAAGALGFRTPTAKTVAVQKQAFRTERNESVRLAILSNLGRAQEAFPALKAVLRNAAAHDPSPNVRKAAASLLTMSARRS
jgi:HEAT repeat protein